MNATRYSQADRECRNWAAQAGGKFWGWEILAEAASATYPKSQDHVADKVGTLAEAVGLAQERNRQSGAKQVYHFNPQGSAPQGHDAGSIPFLHGLRGVFEGGQVQRPDRSLLWPMAADGSEGSLRAALGCDPADLELTPV